MQAALGIAQLESLDRFLLKKRWIGDLYNQLLANISLKLPVPHTDYAENLYWVYGIVLPTDNHLKAIDVMSSLKSMGIGTSLSFILCINNLFLRH